MMARRLPETAQSIRGIIIMYSVFAIRAVTKATRNKRKSESAFSSV